MLDHGHSWLLMVTHDYSQGQVLNLTSAWWMRRTEHIVPNALLAVPDPNVSIMRACSVFPVEFVVRGFMTGVAFPLVHWFDSFLCTWL